MNGAPYRGLCNKNIGWGGSVTALGQIFGAYKRTIAQIGGVIVIMFGLATLEVIRIPWFFADTRAQYIGQRGTFGGSALMGIFFAAGWSPCIGATRCVVADKHNDTDRNLGIQERTLS